MAAAIFSLWRNWAVAVGMLTLVTFVSPLVPRPWVLPVYLLAYLSFQTIRFYLRNQRIPSCARFLQETSVILFIDVVAVLLLWIFGRGENMHNFTGQPYTAATPFVAVLVTAPVTAIVTLIFLLRRGEPMVCQSCRRRFGNVIEHGFVGSLYKQEWLFQTRLLFGLCLLLTVVDWGYCLTRFVNVNFNRADYFYFIWAPLAAYVMSLVYLGIRYYSLWVYYCQNDEQNLVNTPSSTILRFLIFHDDHLLLTTVKTDELSPSGAAVQKFDTPARVKIAYHEKMFLPDAVREFRQITGIPDAEIRLIYASPDAVTFNNIFHYFAFVDDRSEVGDSKIEGEWFSRGELRQLIIQNLLARDLYREITRIYSVAMAWRTYDEKGRRLYPIRNYRPTFRFRDLRDWKVDYNDELWLRVAHRNQDKFFYPVQRFFDGLAAALGMQ